MRAVHAGSFSAGELPSDPGTRAAELRALSAASYTAAVWLGRMPLDETVLQTSGLDWLDLRSPQGALPPLPQLRACTAFVEAHQAISPGCRILLADEGSGTALLALTCLLARQPGVTDPFERAQTIAPGWRPSSAERRVVAGYIALSQKQPGPDPSVRSSSIVQPQAYRGESSGRQNSNALQPGTRLGNYLLIDKLGKGAGGSVWRARDQRNGQLVALKGFTVPREENTRLQQEAEVARLVRSPHVVRILDLVSVPRRETFNTVLVMEFIEGQDLQSRISEVGRLSVEAALATLRQIAEGLSAIHGAGIIHRDLKPANVVVTPEGIVRIVDFGAAAQLLGSHSIGRIGDDPYGTPVYMAPEQWAGYAVEKSDLYALGVMLYQVLCGTPPFNGRTAEDLRYAHLYAPVPPLAARLPDLPPELVQTVEQLLTKRAADRLPSAAALAERLAQIAGSAALAPADRLLHEQDLFRQHAPVPG